MKYHPNGNSSCTCGWTDRKDTGGMSTHLKCYTWPAGLCTCVVTVFCVTWPIKVNGCGRVLWTKLTEWELPYYLLLDLLSWWLNTEYVSLGTWTFKSNNCRCGCCQPSHAWPCEDWSSVSAVFIAVPALDGYDCLDCHLCFVEVLTDIERGRPNNSVCCRVLHAVWVTHRPVSAIMNLGVYRKLLITIFLITNSIWLL